MAASNSQAQCIECPATIDCAELITILNCARPAQRDAPNDYAIVNSLRIVELQEMPVAAVLKTPADLPAPAPIQQLHHYAYRAKDAEETRHFYEDILGLPLYHIIQS